MKAFGYQQFGKPDVFEELNVADAKITSDDQVLVSTRAIGINNFDRIQREGKIGGGEFPIIPGRDVVGEVVKIGDNVSSVAVGDTVIGHAAPAYAQMVVIPESRLVKKPVSVRNQVAAAIITPGITAYNAVTAFTHVRAGDRVLVNGATGGVGSIAVQVAKKLGAYVIGTGSSRNKDLLDELPLDEVGFYDTENINERFADSVDVVINAAMNGNNDTLISDVIRDGGRAASVGNAANLTNKPKVIFEHIRPLDAQHDKLALGELSSMLADGSLKMRIFKTLPLTLSGVIQGHQLLEEHHAPGRIILAND
ncbi:NADP-dependent oxidoreductase [Paucilactobacillus suebicus]|uniref:NADPH quinone reductase n=1 Tax=Paucilactobacillus suebicus DSM 5007 = KCTC 3549 TaxID=1423807 RepID=A0A0R1W4U1_9LACO|nr:NADP-dependent oxidoreductase [Paucilactobacillus suebicus]KRM12798.1 NADPH quinone reductase [Paucilactobacillus suebicus DSM 5007 = KCTC 3549]